MLFFNLLAITFLVAVHLIGEATAHYRWFKLIVDDVTYPEYKYTREYDNAYTRAPITDVRSDNIRCNLNAHTYGAKIEVITVSAGSVVGFEADSVVYRPGPYSLWLGRAPADVNDWDRSGARWFRLWERGPTSITPDLVPWHICFTPNLTHSPGQPENDAD